MRDDGNGGKQAIDKTRERGESRMILDTTRPEAVTRDIGEAVVRAVLDYVERTGISRGKIAKALGIGAPTLGQVLNWKYPGNWQQVVVDLDRWLEEQQKRDNAPRATTFVWTKVATEILAVADAATTLGTIGLVYGPRSSGIGKTIALQAIAAEKPGCVMVTIEKVNASYTGVIRAVARELRIGQGQAAYLYGEIKKRLLETPRLLIVDQIHNLCGVKDDKPLFVLSEIHRATGAPQLWAGTTDIATYLDNGKERGRETLAQIASLIMPQRDLLERTGDAGGGGSGGADLGEPLYTLDEVRKVFAKAPMRLAPDAARYLMDLANHPDSGALRTCKNLVVMAATIHAGRGDVISAHMLREVHRMLVSRRAFRRLENQIEDERQAPVAKVG